VREWLEAFEAEDDQTVQVAYLAAQLVQLDEDELNASLRRTVFVLAAGGDPHRALDLDGRAVTALAAELDAPGRREQLAGALAELEEQAAGLPRVAATLARLRGDGELAWRALAAALLAAELAAE
jgi:hypothetical protein